ncbi:hypothetical protein [Streptomyces caniscabiei]|uniref:Secreted protein n=1 Tax=Streptomyces caniscabiei TaxID=2746961 RepID=A0ABU4MJE3_9ACTN|nr:hypothetical protein [Streptomyces caniscabiei]MBE4790965.1 hypothetical protein [Streptomyces caniscabiei]MDX3009592.1 hypothetical protein [Streptomyces caniscabiei]MDX3037237.1 hypothetical protein [Streptomyces caniscabiei]
MQQATQPTTPAAPSEVRESDREAYRRASALKDRIVEQLATLPRSAAVVGELQGFSVRLNFGTNDSSGVLQFAKVAGIEAISAQERSGTWLEARTRIDDIPVCAEVLMSNEACDAFETPETLAAPVTEQLLEADPSPTGPPPVPLGESPVADDAGAAYDQSVSRYVASLGGSVVALVPAVEATATDDPSTISFAPVTADTIGGEE